MYQFSGKLKMLAIALIILGALGTAYSFLSVPTKDEAREILKAAHHGGHGDSQATTEEHGKKNSHREDTHKKQDSNTEVAHNNDAHHEGVPHKVADSINNQVKDSSTNNATIHAKDDHDNHDHEAVTGGDVVDAHKAEEGHDDHENAIAEHAVNTHKKEGHHGKADASHAEEHHLEHALHQMQNRPWSAIYVAMLFFLGITLLVLAFYAGQRVAHAGWSVALFRVFEAITNNIHYVSVFMLLFLIATVLHMNHLFPWMEKGVFDPTHENYDAVVYGKKWFLNTPGWLIRSIIYLTGWNVFRFIIRKKSIKQDNGDLKLHKNIYNICVGFIVFFMISESMMSWDWIMGIDPHWFSTLFGWYVLSTFLVCALTVTAFVTIYLRSKGALPLVNDSHIHDLTKFMFGFSVFWTYLWFAQFMLIWYADIPEETTYYLQRFNEYKVPFLAMVVMNFAFPVLLLINSDFKSIPWFVVLGGVVILIGHYIDLFVMIMPGTVGAQGDFGVGELSGFLFFLGIFIYATFSAFAKADPVPKGNPFLHESETHHYYNIEHRGEDNHGHH